MTDSLKRPSGAYAERGAAAWENNSMSAAVSHPFTWMADIGAPLASDREKYCRLPSLVPLTHTHTLCENVIGYFTPSFFCWLRLSAPPSPRLFSLSCWKTHTRWRRSRCCVNSTLTRRWHQPITPSAQSAWRAGSWQHSLCTCMHALQFIKVIFACFTLFITNHEHCCWLFRKPRSTTSYIWMDFFPRPLTTNIH